MTIVETRATSDRTAAFAELAARTQGTVAVPGDDAEEERRLVTRFVAPHLAAE